MPEEDVVGDNAWHADDLPPGPRVKLVAKLIEVRDPWPRQMQHVEPTLEGRYRPAVKERLLAREQGVPHPVITRRQFIPVLRHRPIVGHARRR
jgi:hypothetical protein